MTNTQGLSIGVTSPGISFSIGFSNSNIFGVKKNETQNDKSEFT
jgi:hypothetical protein